MIGSIFYNIIIGPIEMIIEFIFSIINRIANNPGIAIIGVSLVVNFLVLPLYKKSDDLSEIERNKQKEMKPWLDHIKKSFKGDERYMMTQTYYRQQGYKPIYSLRSSFSLLLQIPFFISAYHYLSNLHILNDASFLFLSNLGQPDGLLQIGSLSINILPIVMTLINVISGAIYLRGLPIRDKIQTYGIAAIFLVLLYNSPSGLVFYWTLNQIFSVCKNIVMKLLPKREKKVRKQPELIDKKIFYLGCSILTILTGLLIPLSVVSSSPQEFIGVNYGPIYLVIYTFSLWLGLFILWFSIFYSLSGNRGKNIFTYLVWIAVVVCLLNFYFFGRNYGNMNQYLVYDSSPAVEANVMIVDILISIALAALIFFILKKWPKAIKSVGTILVIVGIVIVAKDIITVSSSVAKANEIKKDNSSASEDIEPIIPISKEGRNVVVIMLDRAISGYIPQILEEKPELEEKLSGFTYYPNAVSLGNSTNISTPSLFGGYEYSPDEINKRDGESLKDKHNEALSVLPRLFGENDYEVNLIDLPYAGNYDWVSDMSYFNQYKNCEGHIAEGKYSKELTEKYSGNFEAQQQRNFICYSMFRCMPVFLHSYFYDNGMYLTTSEYKGIDQSFLDTYSVLKNLGNMTEIVDSGNTYMELQNGTTHEPVFLSAPSYEPSIEVSAGDGAETDTDPKAHYDVNMASIMKLCDWFDYLRKENAYDNTRIIIVSDHGRALGDFDYMLFNDMDIELYNPLFMVKDFNQKGFSISDEFVSCPDVATFATKDVIDSPINPFTKKAINNETKYSDGVLVSTNGDWNTRENNGNIFRGDMKFFNVSKNVFESGNWKKTDR